MDVLFKKLIAPEKHKIVSENILVDAETGRILAVFHHAGDLHNLIKQHERLKELGGLEN